MGVTRYLAATLGGRCANGYERDQGRRVHAVPYSETLERNGYAIDAAACGAKPGPRSAGWSLRTDLAVNCPRCLRRTDGVQGCPNAAHMGEHACKDRSQCWEPCGELGHSEEHVRVGRDDPAKAASGVSAAQDQTLPSSATDGGA